jgi:hypothetical protein
MNQRPSPGEQPRNDTTNPLSRESLFSNGAATGLGVDAERARHERERIQEITNGIKVNTGTAAVGVVSVSSFIFPKSLVSNAVDVSKCRRLTNLCCGGKEALGHDASSTEQRFINIGLSEYRGVDLHKCLRTWTPQTYMGDKSQTLHCEYFCEEALTYLAAQPDNSSHIMMVGLEDAVLRGPKMNEWAAEMFLQMKRVVPDGGIMCLQDFIFDGRVESEFHTVLYSLQHNGLNLFDASTLQNNRFERVKIDGCIADFYRFEDAKLGVDWYIQAGEKRSGRISLEVEECHGSPMYLVNRK